MNYKEAMADPRVEQANEGLKVEHDKFLNYGVFKAVDETEVLPDDEVIDTTCVIKPKST